MSEFNDKCPTREELQEYACGVPDPRIEEHIHNCAACRASLEKEETITRLLDEYMTPPAELNENILQACKDAQEEDEFLFITGPELRRRRSAFRAWRPYLAAAALLVVGVIIGVAIPSSHDTAAVSDLALTDSVQATDRAIAAVPAATVAAKSMVAKNAMSRPPVEEEVASGPVMVADASEGFSLKDSRAFSNGKTAPQDVTTVSMMNAAPRRHRKAKVAPVNEEVTHVWLADALPSTQELQALANGGDICAPAAVGEDGIMTISLVATDQTVQQITDKLYASSHWRLLSPESPQPAQAERTHFDGHPVKYNIKVVPR